MGILHTIHLQKQYSGTPLFRTLYTVVSLYSGHSIQWNPSIADTLYSGTPLFRTLYTVEPLYSGHFIQCNPSIADTLYSGTPLFWTLWGLLKCPDYRGVPISGTYFNWKGASGTLWVSWIAGPPHFRGPQWGVPLDSGGLQWGVPLDSGATVRGSTGLRPWSFEKWFSDIKLNPFHSFHHQCVLSIWVSNLWLALQY